MLLKECNWSQTRKNRKPCGPCPIYRQWFWSGWCSGKPRLHFATCCPMISRSGKLLSQSHYSTSRTENCQANLIDIKTFFGSIHHEQMITTVDLKPKIQQSSRISQGREAWELTTSWGRFSLSSHHDVSLREWNWRQPRENCKPFRPHPIYRLWFLCSRLAGISILPFALCHSLIPSSR